MSTKLSLVPAKGLTPSVTVPKPTVKVRANNDQAVIAWKYTKPIIDCIGFAIKRRLKNTTEALKEETLPNRIGFEDEPFKKGEQRPSTEWPVQRFVWTDFSVKQGDKVSYQVVPLLYNGEILVQDHKNSSSWTKEIDVNTGVDENGDPSAFQAFFNRGIVSSQFYSVMSKEIQGTKLTVKKVIEGPNTKLRNFLGGFLDNRLFDLLKEVRDNKRLRIHAALYELHQQDLIDLLISIGSRANVILANGAAKKKEDKNADSRKVLKKKGVKVYDRIVDATKKHFAHNKFLVISENGQPKRVWTGSTNWTPGGLYAQVNNAVLIEDGQLAQIYLDEWNDLLNDVKKEKNQYGEDLYDSNAKAFRFHNKNSRVWFAPTRDYKDLQDVEKLLENARESVLFLMFNPGPSDTFFNYIQDLQKRKEHLFVHGVINQDPGASTHKPLIFFHRDKVIESDWNAILPRKVPEAFSFWYEEVSAGMVTIHSKVLVIDPFGDDPYVITGSHNFGPKASRTNDENLVIINDRRLAEEYAVNVLAIYDHYRWRYSLFQEHTDFKGLTRDREWMQQYLDSGERMKELQFWF